jgi:two-component system sensor kinase FixL
MESISRIVGRTNRYVIAVVVVVLAFLIRLSLGQVLGGAASALLMVPAILIASLFGGLGPGVLATALSLPLTFYFIAGVGKEHTIPHLLLLVAVGFSIALMGQSLKRALANARVTEQDLLRREAHLRSILDTSPDATVVFDGEGRIVTFNAAAMRQFGYSQKEGVGADVAMLAPPPRIGEPDPFRRALTNGGRRPRTAFDGDLRGRRKDGSTFPMKLTVGEMSVEGSHYFTSFIEDLTERLQAEAQLAEANDELARLARINELGEMASTLAHELNQPLSAITNYVEGCRRLLGSIDSRVAGRMRNALDESARQAMRAAEIIRHQREFVARGETEQRPENIRTLVEEAGALALVGSRERGINWVFEFAPEAGPVLADRVQIQQVLVNLMRNAMEAMRESSRRLLLVRTLAAGGRVMVEVSDTGPGIPTEIEEKLFQPFVTTKPGGMGIGLSIAKRIIEAHGGEIGFRRGPTGTTFYFSLAVAEESEHAG